MHFQLEMNNKVLEAKVKELVHRTRYEQGFVCSIDILLQLEYLSQKDYDDWRFGHIDCLEKVCKVNLSKLTFINKLIRKFSIELGLTSSWTGYNQYGKGGKRRLRFSKSGDRVIEENYATHYLDKNRLLELKEKKARM